MTRRTKNRIKDFYVKIGIFVGVVSILFAFLFFAIPQICDAFILFANKIGFTLQSVEISEIGHAPNGRKAQDCVGNIYSLSMFKLSIDKIYKKLHANPWISDITVHKAFPNKLLIIVSYKRPIAAFFDGTDYMLIDEHCKDIEKINRRRIKPTLPIICGNGSKENFPQLLKELRNYKNITISSDSFIFVSKRRWNIILKNKTLVKLPQNNINTSLATLETMIQQKIAYGKMIDFRIPTQIIINNITVSKESTT